MYFSSSPLLMNNDLDMNLDQIKDAESAKSIELGDKSGSRSDMHFTIDDSQGSPEIRENLENVIRKYSNPTWNLSIHVKNLETDTAFSPDDPVYTEHCE
ncbi:hypothetical protein NPIL_626581 [Nephila pilipes]|uniref:Uncharacterized protein n=1 Tax=Nephila pilipes TaxID=299642 RepID=A0A8X6THT7_NEPPI|nr:hypothetical protein NPIL_626581 [Nephila pilipes]